MKTVVIFGVFDGLHAGHLDFIRQAKEIAGADGKLVAIVAQDNSVAKLKNKMPKKNAQVRVSELALLPEISQAILGDTEPGYYKVLKSINPDIICLGYDQQTLNQDLEEKIKMGQLPQVQIMRAQSFRPEIFHSSLLE